MSALQWTALGAVVWLAASLVAAGVLCLFANAAPQQPQVPDIIPDWVIRQAGVR